MIEEMQSSVEAFSSVKTQKKSLEEVRHHMIMVIPIILYAVVQHMHRHLCLLSGVKERESP